MAESSNKRSRRGTDVRRRQHQVGVRLLPEELEKLQGLAERYGVAMPVCQEIDRVVRGEITGSQAYRGLYPPARHEADPG